MPDATVQILIKTSAELAGAQAAAAALDRQIGSAKALGKEYGEMEAQLKRANEAIAAYQPAPPVIQPGTAPSQPGQRLGKEDVAWARQQADGLQTQIRHAKLLGEETGHLESKLGRLQSLLAAAPAVGFLASMSEQVRGIHPAVDGLMSKLAAIGSGGLGALAAGAAAATGALKLAKAGLNEYAEAEERVAKIDAALAQRGFLSDANREMIQGVAEDLQRLTKIADDQWYPVLARLIQFGADPSNINTYADAVKNLAGILGGDLSTSAMLISKAMQGHYEAFARYGISVKDAGSQTEKMNALMQQLAARGGGQLEAMGKTINGQWRDVRNTFNDFTEAIGRTIAKTGILQGVLGGVSNFFEAWSDVIGGTVEQVDGLENALQQTTQSTEETVKASEKLADAQKSVSEAVSKASDDLEHQIKILNLQNKTKEEQLKLARDLALIQVDRDVAAGLPPVQAIQRRAAIERKYADDRTVLATQELTSEVRARNQQATEQQSAKKITDEKVVKEKSDVEKAKARDTAVNSATREKEVAEKAKTLDQQVQAEAQKPLPSPLGPGGPYRYIAAAVGKTTAQEAAQVTGPAAAGEAKLADRAQQRAQVATAAAQGLGSVAAESLQLAEAEAQAKELDASTQKLVVQLRRFNEITRLQTEALRVANQSENIVRDSRAEVDNMKAIIEENKNLKMQLRNSVLNQ